MPPVGPTKIVLVDDDETVLQVLRAALEDAGFDVLSRSTALGTSQWVCEEQPDVAVLDVNMPGLTGDRIAGILSGRALASRVLLVLHSGLPRQELEKMRANCGAAGVIEKTGDPHHFIASLRDILQRRLRPD